MILLQISSNQFREAFPKMHFKLLQPPVVACAFTGLLTLQILQLFTGWTVLWNLNFYLISYCYRICPRLLMMTSPSIAGSVFTDEACGYATIHCSSYANVSSRCPRYWAAAILWARPACHDPVSGNLVSTHAIMIN